MTSDLRELLLRLQKLVQADDFLYEAEAIVEEIETIPDAFEAVEPILKLMEENDSVDFGSPGPLVHFVEKFYKHGYEEKLVESLQRRPTAHTLWMLNRVINGSRGESKQRFIRVRDQILRARQ